MSETSVPTMVVFVAYILGVFVLAIVSHRFLSKSSFLNEYFLGSRGLGTWALAFTFAATAASGGSFTGYPSLIYSYGWVLALWIASYMIFPLTTMGIIGKRLNQVARKSGAITIPDVLRDRFESTALGLLATCIMVFLLICFLVAQFKAGALIIEETFNLPTHWLTIFGLKIGGYEVGLVIFTITVVFYTAYGGFRAVVWTDVLQGIVMGIGVVVLIPIVLIQAGGLGAATEKVQSQRPILVTSMKNGNMNGDYNDLVLRATGQTYPDGLLYRDPGAPASPLTVQWPGTEDPRLIEISLETDSSGRTVSTGNDVRQAIEQHPQLAGLVEVEFPFDNDMAETAADGTQVNKGAVGTIAFPENKDNATFVFIRGDEMVFGPGRSNTGGTFHPLGMIISFFFMWAIIGIGQPGMMLRLMAFKESRTLKRAILTVTIYYAMIYLPLIFVMVAARTLLPTLTPENSDKAMVLVATRLVADMGLGYQILGAIFVAAPFAAIMSTVDSFLLMISSGAVRDVYQRTINPQVSDRTVKWVSYSTTIVVGVLVAGFALNPPDFLQKIIVFVSGAAAAAFLCPIVLGLYWKGMTRQGALWSMVGGFVIVVGFFIPEKRIDIFGLHPSIWGLAGSFLLAVLISKISSPAPEHLVRRYFYSPNSEE